jgi:hypothetical protein
MNVYLSDKKSIVETVVHLESFRNIELFYQGLYYLNKLPLKLSLILVRSMMLSLFMTSKKLSTDIKI